MKILVIPKLNKKGYQRYEIVEESKPGKQGHMQSLEGLYDSPKYAFEAFCWVHGNNHELTKDGEIIEVTPEGDEG